ncbi:MAG: hypothetical protein M1831_005965 [Alyxoria varia]|nr:MAG: hypothetical protein M1831_005965 [Alyxoria varia]
MATPSQEAGPNSSMDSNTFPFMDLPAEIRNMIYTLVIGSTEITYESHSTPHEVLSDQGSDLDYYSSCEFIRSEGSLVHRLTISGANDTLLLRDESIPLDESDYADHDDLFTNETVGPQDLSRKHSLAYVSKQASAEYLSLFYADVMFIFKARSQKVWWFDQWSVSAEVLGKMRHCKILWDKSAEPDYIPNYSGHCIDCVYCPRDHVNICITSLLEELPDLKTLAAGVRVSKWQMVVQAPEDKLDSYGRYTTHFPIDVEEFRSRLGEYVILTVPEQIPEEAEDGEKRNSRLLCWEITEDTEAFTKMYSEDPSPKSSSEEDNPF